MIFFMAVELIIANGWAMKRGAYVGIHFQTDTMLMRATNTQNPTSPAMLYEPLLCVRALIKFNPNYHTFNTTFPLFKLIKGPAVVFSSERIFPK